MTKPNMSLLRLPAGVVLQFLMLNVAFAHDNREPGVLGWFRHEYDQHPEGLFILAGLGIGGLCIWGYRKFFEPDYEKALRKRKDENSPGSGCGSGGCGGCGS